MRRMRVIRRLVLALFLAAPMGATAGEIITVDDDGPADFNNIQAAINAANNGDTVLVADGIYTGDGLLDRLYVKFTASRDEEEDTKEYDIYP